MSQVMNLEQRINAALEFAFDPVFLKVENISHMHSVPHGAETHFQLYVVSDKFADKKLIQRQRMVHDALSSLMPQIHSITQKLQTPSEWAAAGKPEDFNVPECFGGAKE